MTAPPAPDLPPVAEAEPPVGRALVTALLGVVALGLLSLVLAQASGADTLDTLRARADLPMLVLSQLVMAAGMTCMARRWRALIPGGEALPVLPVTGILCAGLLLNTSLPGPVGELAAAGLIQRRYGLPATLAFAANVHSRLIGLSCAALLALGAWAGGSMPTPPGYESVVGLAAGFIALGATAMGVASWRPDWLVRAANLTLGVVAARLPGALGRGAASALSLALEVSRALGEVARHPPLTWARAIFWAFAGHATATTGILLGAWSVGLDPSVAGVLFTYCAATAGVIVLFAVPGAQLGWDALFIGFFVATTGVGVAEAVLVMAMVRLQQVLLMGVGAVALTGLGGGQASPLRS
ncbi:flippase-like domain-containing protein [Myxococcota bacterium]|nr:flippase-like domain-containing protein [Myxococcota bacterium]